MVAVGHRRRTAFTDESPVESRVYTVYIVTVYVEWNAGHLREPIWQKSRVVTCYARGNSCSCLTKYEVGSKVVQKTGATGTKIYAD